MNLMPLGFPTPHFSLHRGLAVPLDDDRPLSGCRAGCRRPLDAACGSLCPREPGVTRKTQKPVILCGMGENFLMLDMMLDDVRSDVRSDFGDCCFTICAESFLISDSVLHCLFNEHIGIGALTRTSRAGAGQKDRWSALPMW
eukprot:s1230_g8.t1